ncbi:hypothetical protein [Nocardia flavorosea]|uniref:Uncharacterized protein n=1 Tax=Nocardia flavorosea TaxID=53429 RepID=A0A846YU31_9NOCA|nr:hypothetical protein [Nocardia flavorosea]NKY61050.1 hypothetical protein [Nocardia flavorosea]
MKAGSGVDRVARKIAITGVAGIVLILGGVVVAVIARFIDPPFPLTRTYSSRSADFSSENEITAHGDDVFGEFSDIRIEDASAHFANTAIIAAARSASRTGRGLVPRPPETEFL